MIVVTAPTGNIGHQVLDRLLDTTDQPLRVIARDPAKLTAQARERVDVVTGSHGDPDVLAKAFAGADTVFWLLPPDFRAASLEDAFVGFTRPAARAFAEQGVQRVVGVSALGRGTPQAAHAGHVTASLAMDDLIASTGVSYRALTMPSFMDNLLRSVDSIRTEGVFFDVIDGDRRHPTCATRDIAEVAVRLLLDDSWSGTAEVPLLGPEDLSQNEMAAVMTEVLGRPVRYQRISTEALKARMLGIGATEAMAQGMVDMMVAKDQNMDDHEARTPSADTPTTFRRWCELVLKPAVEVSR
jgi:uncharacterized protein YbjT (DUF2867 family)